MKLKFTYQDGVSPELARLHEALTGPQRADLHQEMGLSLRDLLVAHFEQRDREPNKRGWPKTHFWGRMRRATSLASATAQQAVVTVADPAMAAKVKGATIRPSGKPSPATGKPIRNIAIPLRSEAYGSRPSEFAKDTFFLLVDDRKFKCPL